MQETRMKPNMMKPKPKKQNIKSLNYGQGTKVWRILRDYE